MEEFPNQLTYIVVHGVLLTIVKTFGIIGDVLTLFVISRKAMLNMLTPILQAMVATDLIFLLVSYPAHIVFAMRGRQLERHDPIVQIYLAYFYFILTAILIASSSWLVLTVAIYRYIAIRFPFKAKSLLSLQRSRIAILIIMVLSVVLNIPRFYVVIATFDNSSVSNMTSPTDDDVGMTISDVISMVLASAVPWAFCALFMFLSRKGVRAVQRQLQDSTHSRVNTSRKSIEAQLTNTFTVILIVFLVLMFPQAVRHICRTIVGFRTWYNGRPAYVIVDLIGDIAIFSYFSVNFLLYTATSSLFRSQFVLWAKDVGRKCGGSGARDLPCDAAPSRESVGSVETITTYL